MGINTIYGQCDIINTLTEEYAFCVMDICAELGLDYLVKDQISKEYCSLGEPMFEIYQYRDFRTLTEEEKCELDMRFEKSLLRYKAYPAFKRMIFIDELGKEMFDGIAREKVFDKHCSDKLFLVNHLHHRIENYQYQFSWKNKKDEPIEEQFVYIMDRSQIKHDGFYYNTHEKYDKFIDCFFEKIDTPVFFLRYLPVYRIGGV